VSCATAAEAAGLHALHVAVQAQLLSSSCICQDRTIETYLCKRPVVEADRIKFVDVANRLPWRLLLQTSVR
jgi:hypothetical protein